VEELDWDEEVQLDYADVRKVGTYSGYLPDEDLK
jgi:hypothetical protein